MRLCQSHKGEGGHSSWRRGEAGKKLERKRNGAWGDPQDCGNDWTKILEKLSEHTEKGVLCLGLESANDSAFEGPDADSKTRGHLYEPVLYPASVVPAPTHCLKAASAESRGLCNPYKPVSCPQNTSFISYKCLSPFSSNMLRVTTFPASWGSCPLHTVITHSIKAVSKPSFSALFSWPFVTDQLKSKLAASLLVKHGRHFGSVWKRVSLGGSIFFLLLPLLSEVNVIYLVPFHFFFIHPTRKTEIKKIIYI